MYSAAFSFSSWPSPISSRRNDALGRPRVRAAALAALIVTVAALGAAAGAAPARAAAPPSRAGTVSPADSAARATQPKTAPFKVMMRSAIFPGWGQLYNHQPIKAAIVLGGEGFLVTSALRELKKQNDAIQRAADLEVFGDPAGAAAATLDAETHRNRKISWIWWTVAAHLLSMADAYVDAHLSTFDSDFGREDSLLPSRPGSGPVVSLAYRIRF